MSKAELLATVARWEHVRFACTIVAALAAIGMAVGFAKVRSTNARLQPILAAESQDATKAIAEANARAAEANEKTEAEKLARLKIEERLADRNLSKQQEMEIAEKLRKYAGQVVSIIGAPTPEPTGVSYAINRALSAAGWAVTAIRSSDPRTLHGITVRNGVGGKKEASTAAQDLVNALSSCGLSVTGPVADPNAPADGVLVIIGER